MRRRLPPLLLISSILIGCGSAWHFPGGLTVNFPGFTGDPLPTHELQEKAKVPEGFAIATYAAELPSPRFLRFTAKGDLLVSAPGEGKIFLLEADANGDGASDGTLELISGLNKPHGIDVHDGWLYIGEGDAIARVRFDADTRRVSDNVERIVRDLPSGGNHWTRTVAVGPDGKLYVSIGSSCNDCVEDDQRRAAIMQFDIDGSNGRVYATGLRNAVGFAWQPGTNDLYATDNGRDLLGDDFPPCELDRIVDGGFYGWPIAHGNRVPDPSLGKGEEARIAASIPPSHAFGAHTAPLGITFYEGTTFPAKYRGAAFVAEHGSWNRSRKSGYQVVVLFFDTSGGIREEPFVTGLMVDDRVYGRPVDVAVGPEGALYISDDYTGSVYRVAYGEVAKADLVTAPQAGASGDPLAGLTPEERAAASTRGQALFDDNDCGTCHVEGRQQKGETYKPLEALSRKYTIDALAKFLAAPQPPMPLFPLSEAERRALAVYLLGSRG